MRFADLKNNITLMSVSVLVFVLVISVMLVDYRLVSRIDKVYNEQLDELVSTNLDNMEVLLDGKIRLVNMLYNTPPIQGLARASKNNDIDPYDGTPKDLWEKRLATIFSATLKAYPGVEQLRLIRADNGMEWIRADRTLASVDIVPPAKLQDKSNRDYFTDAVALQERSVYVSQINLNRERGEFEYPYKPTMRIAMPAYDIDNKVFAVLVMNISAQPIFELLEKAEELDSGVFITNSNHSVIHADLEWMNYWNDLTPERTLKTEFDVTPWIHKNTFRIVNKEHEADWFVKDKFYRLPGKGADHGIHLYAYISYQQYLQDLWRERFDAYFILGIVSIVFIIIFFTLNNSLKKARQISNLQSEFEGIINGSDSAIIGIKLGGQVFSANNVAKNYFPELRGNLNNLHFESVSRLPNDFVDTSLREIMQQKLPAKFDSHLALPNLTEIDIEYSASPIRDAEGNLAGIAILAEDISARKEAERQLAASNKNLQEQVAERTRELEDAKNKAEQVSDIKSSFISTVSHEMRTPLNGIMGMLRMLKSGRLNKDQLRYLEMSETSCETLNTLINDVLDLSKIEAGKFDLEKEQFNILSVIEHACISLAVKANEKQLDFVLDINDIQHIAMQGDASRIRQIIFNLLSNAIKFTHRGQVKLYAKSWQEDNTVNLEIAVSDTGIGIAKDKQAQLFQSFTQADVSISGNYGGTGLGLSICKRLSELMGGRVSLYSEENKGSTFTLQLPFKANETLTRPDSDFLATKCFDVSNIEGLYFTEPLVKIIKGYGGDIASDTSQSTDYKVHYLNDEQTQDLSNYSQSDILVVESFTSVDEQQYKVLRTPIRIQSVITLFAPEQVKTLAKIKAQTHIQATSTPNIKGLKGKSVLVVDDNQINLEVAKGVFIDTGVAVETALSGQQAISILSAAPADKFDVILLDINMPGLNGYETANFIRTKAEVTHYAKIPIVAMTANAMAGEQERCLAAGMNGHLSKPIVPEQLFNKLCQVLKVPQESSAHKSNTKDNILPFTDGKTPNEQPEKPKQRKKTRPEIKPEIASVGPLDYDSALRMLGSDSTDIHKKVCAMYLQQTPEKMTQLHKSLAEEDHQTAGEICHNLKGVSANIGALHFSDKCSEMEIQLQQGKLKDGAAEQQLQQLYDEVIDEIKRYIA